MYQRREYLCSQCLDTFLLINASEDDYFIGTYFRGKNFRDRERPKNSRNRESSIIQSGPKKTSKFQIAAISIVFFISHFSPTFSVCFLLI